MTSSLKRNMLNIFNKQRRGFISVAFRQNSTRKYDNNILKSVYKDLPVSNYTVNDFVWENLDRWPDKTATVCAVTGHGYTYAQTHRMSVTFAAALRKKIKLQTDDKVAVILPNVPEYPCTVLGILQAGCIASMMNPVYSSDEFKHQIQQINCKAIVTSKISYQNVRQALTELKLDIPVITTDNEILPGAIKFAELAEDFNIDTSCLKSIHRSPKDIGILPFSSGTTGLPKAVVLTHQGIVALNQQIAYPEIVAIKETTASYQPVLPAILPFFHIFGFNAVMMNQMSLGSKLVTLPYFKPELFLKTLVQYKPDCLFLVPPMAIFLGKHPAVTPKHLESLYSIICGAAPLSASDIEAVIAKNKNINFRQGYGLTETNGAVSIAKNSDVAHDSVGYVLASSEVKIADLNTQEALGPGQEGELWYRGPNLMSGYYENEEATKEVLTEDGWFKTGDIGRYDENQYLYITDRLKELIKVKGFQVPPAELETVLRTHPKVLDCAVLGIPDPISGECPKAFIVTHQGVNIPEEEILDYVNSKVAVFKKIREVQFVKEIPKNAAVELAHQISITEPKAIVTIRECYDTVKTTLKNCKKDIKIILIDNPVNPVPNNAIRYSEIAESGKADYELLDKIERKQDDVACIPFSSGTTGLPKGVEITYGNLVAALEMMGQKEVCYPVLTHGDVQDVVPSILPFFHIYGLVVNLIGHFAKGCKMITMSKFSASLYLETLKSSRASLLYIVPPIAILLGKHPDVNEEHFRNVRHICCGAAPLSAPDVEAIQQKSKHDIEFNQGFGATETTSLGTSTFKGTKNIDYSACGVPMANITLKFADPITGEPIPIGQQGEMYIKGPTIMKGYHKNPTATAECMTEDGYFKTGDLGYFKPGVGMFITDRIKELIKVKGMQVAPAELESLLRSHPAVQDAAVIGVPHQFFGEAPKAFIIRKNGLKITEEEIQDYVASKVAVYKRIEEVMFVDDIPKTSSGKILRKELKKMYA